MPSYDYECRNCGHRIEVLHGVNDTGPTACERCAGPMRKLLSTPNIVFKGSGWAKKDARDARPASTSTASTGKAETTGSANSSGDSSGGDSGTKGDSSTNSTGGTEGTTGTTGTTGPKDSSTGGASAD